MLGVVTATWHLPYWTFQGVVASYGAGYLATNYVFIAAFSIQIAWLFNRADSSIATAVALHLVFNAVNVAVLPVTSNAVAYAILTAMECVIAGVAVADLIRMPRDLRDPVPSQ